MSANVTASPQVQDTQNGPQQPQAASKALNKKAAKPKSPKAKNPKPAAPKVPAAHPPYIQMIKSALTELKEKKGSSRAAILKYITINYTVGDTTKANAHLKQALKHGVQSGDLKQVKGVGASGSFKLGDNKAATAKPKPSPSKVVSSPKKSPAKKLAAGKKTTVAVKKTTPKKNAATAEAKKSPTKSKKAKPATAAASTAQAATASPQAVGPSKAAASKKTAPKKVAKSPAKKSAAKKASPKKAAAAGAGSKKKVAAPAKK